jgi:hypothetical protein
VVNSKGPFTYYVTLMGGGGGPKSVTQCDREGEGVPETLRHANGIFCLMHYHILHIPIPVYYSSCSAL